MSAKQRTAVMQFGKQRIPFVLWDGVPGSRESVLKTAMLLKFRSATEIQNAMFKHVPLPDRATVARGGVERCRAS